MQTVLFTRIGHDRRSAREDIDALVERGIDAEDISVVSPQGAALDPSLAEFLMILGGAAIGFIVTMAFVPAGVFSDPFVTLLIGAAGGAVLLWLALNPLTDEAGALPKSKELLLAVQVRDAKKERTARRVISKREDAVIIEAVRSATANAKKRNLIRQRPVRV